MTYRTEEPNRRANVMVFLSFFETGLSNLKFFSPGCYTKGEGHGNSYFSVPSEKINTLRMYCWHVKGAPYGSIVLAKFSAAWFLTFGSAVRIEPPSIQGKRTAKLFWKYIAVVDIIYFIRMFACQRMHQAFSSVSCIIKIQVGESFSSLNLSAFCG